MAEAYNLGRIASASRCATPSVRPRRGSDQYVPQAQCAGNQGISGCAGHFRVSYRLQVHLARSCRDSAVAERFEQLRRRDNGFAPKPSGGAAVHSSCALLSVVWLVGWGRTVLHVVDVGELLAPLSLAAPAIRRGAALAGFAPDEVRGRSFHSCLLSKHIFPVRPHMTTLPVSVSASECLLYPRGGDATSRPKVLSLN
jgi:hypothetical protein